MAGCDFRLRRRFVQSLLSLTLVALTVFPLQAATFEIVEEAVFEKWRSILFSNTTGNRLFCALQSEDGSTVFRLNQYKIGKDTFLELFNPDWNMMEGDVRFSLEFESARSSFGMEFRGQSWGDSYTYDILDKDAFETLLEAIGGASHVTLVNSNGAPLGFFDLGGSSEAVAAFRRCLAGEA